LYINDKTPKPQATGSKALVRVKAFGLNRMDIGQRNGKYPLPPHAPKTLGVEYSGVIEELGPDNSDLETEKFEVGDEVFGLAYGGGCTLTIQECFTAEIKQSKLTNHSRGVCGIHSCFETYAHPQTCRTFL
jgi:NADPH:quinone reductase-like Zn-dependent oxidoreductase